MDEAEGWDADRVGEFDVDALSDLFNIARPIKLVLTLVES